MKPLGIEPLQRRKVLKLLKKIKAGKPFDLRNQDNQRLSSSGHIASDPERVYATWGAIWIGLAGGFLWLRG